MITLAEYSMEEIIPLLGIGRPNVILNTTKGPISTNVGSSRLECLRRNQQCVTCGRTGTRWLLQKAKPGTHKLHLNCFVEDCQMCYVQRYPKYGGDNPHLNLYAVGRNNGLVLMTQDHIVPLSRGGSRRDQSNLQTMCTKCNNNKGDRLMSELLHITGVRK